MTLHGLLKNSLITIGGSIVHLWNIKNRKFTKETEVFVVEVVSRTHRETLI